jgi:hypothetical protein
VKAKIHILAVAYLRLGELKVFVQSIINQSSDDWFLTICHDGPNEEFSSIMENYVGSAPNKIKFFHTDSRFNDYGHTLRDLMLKEIEGEYVLLTNADNYFIPKAIEYLKKCTTETNAEVVIYDMIHSHVTGYLRYLTTGANPQPYLFFETSFKRGSIDVSSAIVIKNLAEKVGFRDKTHDGDATYFEDILQLKKGQQFNLIKIPRVLFVHN